MKVMGSELSLYGNQEQFVIHIKGGMRFVGIDGNSGYPYATGFFDAKRYGSIPQAMNEYNGNNESRVIYKIEYVSLVDVSDDVAREDKYKEELAALNAKYGKQ